MPKFEVRELTPAQFPLWDRFVAASPQGAIYSETLWLRAGLSPFRIFGCYKGDELVGGVAALESADGRDLLPVAPLTPFQGILFRDLRDSKLPARYSLEMQITQALLDVLEKRYRQVNLVHHYAYHDLRPFFFRTFGALDRYEVDVRYTLVVALNDLAAAWSAMDSNTHCEVHKAEKNQVRIEAGGDFECFLDMHRRTFERQGQEVDAPEELIRGLYSALKNQERCRLYLARLPSGQVTSGMLAIWDAKRAYYQMGASEPAYRNNGSASLVLWHAFQDLRTRLNLFELDMVGCNSPRRGAFKTGFGGQLRHYFALRLVRNASPVSALQTAACQMAAETVTDD